MRKLILKITAIATGCAMVLGAGYLAQAKNNKEVINTKKENLVDPIVKPADDGEPYWFALVPTSSTSTSSQTLVGTTPTPIPAPAKDDENDCAQSENEGLYCAVAFKFSQTITNLNGYTTVKDVVDNHPHCLGIATDDVTIDADEDGYSRMPE